MQTESVAGMATVDAVGRLARAAHECMLGARALTHAERPCNDALGLERNMSTLRAIVYVSTATQAMTVRQLESLLLEIRELNERNAVTGVLLYSDGNFMQCIEGPEESLYITYDRIRASRRHTDIIEILNAPIGVRTFSEWQMGFAQPTKSELMALSTAQWETTSLASGESTSVSPGLLLLKSFWERARR